MQDPTPLDAEILCPHCSSPTANVTEHWHTFKEAEGAEYLADYVTIWQCEACATVVGAQDGSIEWVMEPQEAPGEE